MQMATMVISEATNMKIAARKAALQNLCHRSIIKLSKNLLQVKFFQGTVKGRKSPKHELYQGTDGYYAYEMFGTALCQR